MMVNLAPGPTGTQAANVWEPILIFIHKSSDFRPTLGSDVGHKKNMGLPCYSRK